MTLQAVFFPARVHVPEGGDRALGIETEMQRDHLHEAFREDAGWKLLVPAGLERGDVPNRDLCRARELLPAHVSKLAFAPKFFAEFLSSLRRHPLPRNVLA